MKNLILLLLAAMSLAAQTYQFSDGGRRTRMEFAPNEAYVTVSREQSRGEALARVRKALGANVKSADETGGSGFVVVLATPARRALQLQRNKSLAESFQSAAPVFYDAAEAVRPAARRFMTSRLLVKVGSDESAWEKLREATQAQSRKSSLIQGWSLVEYGDPYKALDAADSLLKAGGWEFTPVFARQMEKRQNPASGTLQREVNDPLYPNQWHLKVGDAPNLKLNASWDVATGKGINVTVVDDGVEVAHEDLAGNAYALDTNYHRNFNTGTPNDPTPSEPGQNHGTNCAGLIGAIGFNKVGVIGVAPEASLMGLRLIAEAAGEDATGEAMAWQPENVVTHVSSNSWGPSDDGKALGVMSELQTAGIVKANGYREGLGTVFLVAAGNGRQSGDNSSYDGFSSSRLTIGVGAVGRTGDPSSFSEQGINVAITAFGGEFNPPDVTWTTNNSGDAALASLKSKFETSQAPVNYSDAFNGTSAATPQVSGAVALMLQLNPKLNYRDVKEILMKTATKTGLQNGDEFKDNGAGFTFSHSFGAGLLNVSAALDLAATWTSLGELTSATVTTTGSNPIPDGVIDGASYDFDFSAQPALRVEHVEFIVNVQHANRGDLGFVLTSPSGMTSIVENRVPDTGANFENYKFTSVRHWGETSTGVWKVKVIDITGNQVTGTAGDITVNIWGTAAPAPAATAAVRKVQ